MEQGISTITTVFTSQVNGITYEYEATQQAGKTPQAIVFRVKQDNKCLVIGNNRPLDGYFNFETQTKLTTEERAAINNQINADLDEVLVIAKNIGITNLANI